ncbi:MAG: cupin domain-containing protein [Alphaproteobacteria bacterium]|nr:MAG: cupin domain-containing protein [Alphaproteobacteria bacterium]
MTTASTEPVIARKKPYLVRLAKKGRTYWWCACGRSRKQPFCDGSHKGTGIEPVPYVAKADGEEVLFCGCKHTRHPPLCDGSHNNLGDTYEEASADEIAATADIPVTPFDETGRARLDGGCFVLRPAGRWREIGGGWRMEPLITAEDGARHLAQYRLLAEGRTAPLTFGQNSEVVLFACAGAGELMIAGRACPLAPLTGYHVLPGETVELRASPDGPAELIATQCPLGKPPALAETSAAVASAQDERLRWQRYDPARRERMADRFYQVLVGPETGSEQVTLFIGEIPRSRAAGHRHLYEEAIVILTGSGFMWTERARAAVRPGDVIFLPARQIHSLECTDPGGMRLAGAFYPAGSPAINY